MRRVCEIDTKQELTQKRGCKRALKRAHQVPSYESHSFSKLSITYSYATKIHIRLTQLHIPTISKPPDNH